MLKVIRSMMNDDASMVKVIKFMMMVRPAVFLMMVSGVWKVD